MNISYFLHESEEEKKEPCEDANRLNIDDLMMRFHSLPCNTNEYEYDGKQTEEYGDLMSDIVAYESNYSVKQLLQICDYYGILAQNRNKKKSVIVANIIIFEQDNENIEIVIKRKEMWYYIEQLKNEPKMKKYILM